VQIKIRLESEAKLYIQEQVLNKSLQLVWSYMLDFENEHNPFEERAGVIGKWKGKAVICIEENETILSTARILFQKGLKSKDAIHIACAIYAGCDYFITTDEKILKKLKSSNDIKVMNPLEYIRQKDN
jgi:predicted nucleic acid-binding protein